MRLPTDTELRAAARGRDDLHDGQPSQRKLSANYELIGLVGERTFSRASGLQMDLSPRIGGDKGIDFRTRLGTLDVKTARGVIYLAVEEHKVRARLYVLAKFIEPCEAELVGWAWDSEVLRSPVGLLPRGSIPSHLLPRAMLRPFGALLSALAAAA